MSPCGGPRGCDVVDVATGDAFHEACGDFVGDAAYLVGGTLIDLASGARRALGPLYFLAQPDRALMIAQEKERVVVIRRADAAVAVMPVGAERVVVNDRFIAAAGQGKLAVLDRATMQVRVDDIGDARGAIGIAGDTVLVALRGHRMLAVTDGRKAILPLGK